MCGLFFSFDHPNYARYSALYLVIMFNLDKSHPGAEELLKRNGFSVNRSDVPSSRTAVDITIEQTINRHAKSHGGIVGFSREPVCVLQVVPSTTYKSELPASNQRDREYGQPGIYIAEGGETLTGLKGEHNTCSVIQAISNVTYPFTIEDKDELYCLSSEVPLSSLF